MKGGFDLVGHEVDADEFATGVGAVEDADLECGEKTQLLYFLFLST